MRVLILGLLITFLSVIPAQAVDFLSGKPKTEFLPEEQAFVFSVEPLDDGQTRLQWIIAPGYYLYQNRLLINGQQAHLLAELPEAIAHRDDYFGEVAIYRSGLELYVPKGVGGSLSLSWQGCADAGLCYPPTSQQILLTADTAAVVDEQVATDQRLSTTLAEQSLAWSLVLFFALGLALAFTPCSLPMLPILAGVVIGPKRTLGRSLALALTYTVSMALVYAGLGVLAASLGSNLQMWLMQPWLIASFAALFVLLALPMFGLFELQLPAVLRDRLERAGRQQQGGNLLGAAGLGVLSGLLIGPCMTAPLAAALLFISQSGDLLQGGLALFALGLGVGAPLVALVTVGQRFLPKPGVWMNRVKVALGFVFLVAAWYVLRPLLPVSLWVGLLGALFISLACSLLLLPLANVEARIISRTLAVLSLSWGLIVLVGASAGSQSLSQPLQVFRTAELAVTNHAAWQVVSREAELERILLSAQSAGQWVLIDYYADWCVACLAMEENVFAKPEVQATLAGVRLVRLDVTSNTAESQALLKRYQVMGPPSILWIDPDGRERRTHRIVGQVSADSFMATWQALRFQ